VSRAAHRLEEDTATIYVINVAVTA